MIEVGIAAAAAVHCSCIKYGGPRQNLTFCVNTARLTRRPGLPVQPGCSNVLEAGARLS